MMVTSDDYRYALESEVVNLLQQADIFAPPVDAIRLAQRLKLTIAWDRSQSGRGRIARVAGRPTIFLRPDDRPERLQWAAAHELGEASLGKICYSLGVRGEDLAPHERERLANAFAKFLLLPTNWFPADSQACDFSLLKLKAKYSTASHELIACRWLDGERPGMVTVFDHGTVNYRRSNLPAKVPITAEEQACWSQLRRTRQFQRLDSARFTIRGWCVDSPGWQREILYAAATSDQFSQSEE